MSVPGTQVADPVVPRRIPSSARVPPCSRLPRKPWPRAARSLSAPTPAACRPAPRRSTPPRDASQRCSSDPGRRVLSTGRSNCPRICLHHRVAGSVCVHHALHRSTVRRAASHTSANIVARITIAPTYTDARQEPIAASSSFALCPPPLPGPMLSGRRPMATPPACRAPLRQGRRVGEHRTPDSTSSSEPAAGGRARAIEPWIHSGHSQESSGCPQCPAPRCGVLQGSPSQAPPADRLPMGVSRSPRIARSGAEPAPSLAATPAARNSAPRTVSPFRRHRH